MLVVTAPLRDSHEQATLLDFLTKATTVLEAETVNLRQGAARDHSR